MKQPAWWSFYCMSRCFGIKPTCKGVTSGTNAEHDANWRRSSSNGAVQECANRLTNVVQTTARAISFITDNASTVEMGNAFSTIRSTVKVSMQHDRDKDSAYLSNLRVDDLRVSPRSFSQQSVAREAAGFNGEDVIQQLSTVLLGAPGRLLEMRSQVCQLQPLGRGGQAVVLRGVWQLADVAVKLVVADPASTPTSTLSRLLLEGPLSKRLRAPNVVETYCYSVTRLTSEDIRQCNEADRSPATVLSAVSVQSHTLDIADFVRELQSPASGWRSSAHEQRSGGEREGEGDVLGPLRSFDSMDGFGSARRSTAAVLTYSNALSRAGAAPGCFLTQIVMEFCDQGSLAGAVARGAYAKVAYERPALFAYLRTLYDIAAGMSYLHSNGVIHGDLKPGNVLLRSSRVDLRGYQAKVADFGLAQCTAPGKNSLPAEADWSSHPYMAPEHFDGRLVMSSDVWSFAATAHHMWTGMLPYAGLHPMHVCAGVCDGSLRLEAPPLMSPQLWRLLRSCMADDWRRRPTFPQIRAALRRLEDELCGDGLSAHGGLHRE